MRVLVENIEEQFHEDPMNPFKAKITCHSGNSPFYIRYYNHEDYIRDRENSIVMKFPCNQLIYFFGGDWISEINQKISLWKNGDIVVIRSGELKSGVAVKDTCLEYLQIDIPLDAFGNVDDSEIFTDIFKTNAKDIGNVFSTIDKDYDAIASIANKLRELLEFGETNQMLIYSYVIRFMHKVHGIISNNQFRSEDGVNNGLDKLYEAIKYINDNFTTIGSLKEIADIINMDVTYLCRKFKKKFGYTLHEYIISRKIECAKNLLCRMDKNVTEACYESGFNDYTNFITVFKKNTGYTPLKYKNLFSKTE